MTSNSYQIAPDDIATGQILSAVNARHASEHRAIDGDTNLFDLGVDSMNMTEPCCKWSSASLVLDPEDLSSDLFLRFDNLVAFVASHVPSN